MTKKDSIKRYVNMMVKTGQWPRGAKTLSENQLAIKFKCSRLTARQALTDCVKIGLLISRQGRGYFVPLSNIKINEKADTKTQFIISNSFSEKENKYFEMLFDVKKMKKEIKICLYKTYYQDKIGKFQVLKSYIFKEGTSSPDLEKISASIASYLSSINIVPVKQKTVSVVAAVPQEIMLKLGTRSVDKIPTTYSVLLDENDEPVECSILYTKPEHFIKTSESSLL